MSRLNKEVEYWDNNALDPEVDEKYICEFPMEDCLLELGNLDGDVLDVGCGVGRLTPSGQQGIDISENMLKIARERRPDCTFTKIDKYFPFENNSFDIVFSFLVVQHIKKDTLERYAKEAYRVLRKGGEFKFQFIEGSEREPFSNHYSVDEIFEILSNAGFDGIGFKSSSIHHQWVYALGLK